MIINGISIPILCVFVGGLKYEKNDLIYYKGNLYQVNSPYDGFQAPNNSPQCELYIDNIDSLSIIKAGDLIPKLSAMIDGLRAGGYIGTIQQSELDSIKRNCIYQISIDSQSICPYQFTGVLRCYSLSRNLDRYVQELVDYGDANRAPNLFYRLFSNNSWSAWTPIATFRNSAELNAFGANLTALSNKANQIISDSRECEELIKTAPFNILKPSITGDYIIGDDPCTLNIIIGYTIDGIQYQETVSMDPMDVANNVAVSLVASNKIIQATKYDQISGARIKLTPSTGIRILKVIQLNQ